MGTDFYDLLADHYDDLFGCDEQTVRFLASSAGSGARVLDVACGTGAHTRALLSHGCDAWGVDLSPAMVDRARQLSVASGRADRFSVGDMLAVSAHPRIPFDLVFCIGNSIAHLDSSADVRRFIHEAQRTLAPGGAFVVQFVDIGATPVGSARELPALKSDSVTMRRTYHRVSADEIRFDAVLEVGSAPSARASQRLLALRGPEVVSMLGESGFRNIELFGGFDGSAPDPAGWVRVVRARR